MLRHANAVLQFLRAMTSRHATTHPTEIIFAATKEPSNTGFLLFVPLALIRACGEHHAKVVVKHTRYLGAFNKHETLLTLDGSCQPTPTCLECHIPVADGEFQV
jgi:hypothetical protein